MVPPYTLIEAIKTLRQERGWTLDMARDEAIRQFISKGYDLPEWAKRCAK